VEDEVAVAPGTPLRMLSNALRLVSRPRPVYLTETEREFIEQEHTHAENLYRLPYTSHVSSGSSPGVLAVGAAHASTGGGALPLTLPPRPPPPMLRRCALPGGMKNWQHDEM